MIELSLWEFTTRRRGVQEELEKRFAPIVERALPDKDWNLLIEDALSIYPDLYRKESGSNNGGTVAPGFPSELRETLNKTKGDGDATVHRIAAWLATRLLSEVAADAAIHDEADVFLEWVDMHDEKVRPTHHAANGQQRPVGEPFEVGGEKMRFPGDTSASVDEWIECRCTVRPVLASEAASFAVSEKSWDGSAGRFTPEQWKASCIFHLADDLNKSNHKLPIKEPGGALSRAGVHAAASRLGSTDGPPEAKARAKASLRGAYKTLGEQPPDNLAASFMESILKRYAGTRIDDSVRPGEPDPNTPKQDDPNKAPGGEHGAAVVALPPKDHPVNKVGDAQKHVTLAYSKHVKDPEALKNHVANMAKVAKKPAMAHVAGKAQIGPDKAHALLLESHDLQSLHDQVKNHPDMQGGGAHPNFIPHMTTSYNGNEPEPEGMDSQAEVPLDRLAVWHGNDQTEYPLGDDVDPNTDPQAEADQAKAEKDASQQAAAETWTPTPWHGVLAPENVWSGDRRRFGEGSLSTRPLPLPLTWQKVSDDGHRGNVVVAKIERTKMIDGLMHSSGTMLGNPEADEFTGLLAEFGRFGVSVDADDIEMAEDNGEEGVTFTKARISSACAVPIPAFAEAWIALGEAPGEWALDEQDQQPAEALVASGMFSEALLQQFDRGPGWVTNPEATRRIHAYWTTPGEPGFDKVGWGTEGDYSRCLTELGEEIGENSPDTLRFMHQICAQWQHDAIGIWPGKGEKAAADVLELEDRTPAPALSLVAAGGRNVKPAPAGWFKDPEFKVNDGRMAQDRKGNWGCAITVTDDLQVYGHAALWNTCHIAYGANGQCVVVPKDDDFSYFNVGQVPLDDGTRANTGIISLGGGHADEYGGVRGATAHYDSTSSAVCDVTVGADEFGIWMAGRVRPGVTEEQIAALMASKVSGDWREVQGALTLVAVLAVNVPGFGVPRPKVAASVDGLSLVAAGVFEPVQSLDQEPLPSFDVTVLAKAVADEMETRTAKRLAWARLKEERDGVRV